MRPLLQDVATDNFSRLATAVVSETSKRMVLPLGNELRASLAHHTVLVIDDNEAVGTAFDVLLSMHGVRVLTATSPTDGLATLKRESVDLVIQDMNFRREATRGEEGMALFREIRGLY